MPPFKSDAPLARLLTLHPKHVDLSLDRMWRLLEALGNPQNRLPPTVHIAGTNGKGSTLAMLAAMLEAGGAGVHSYTSPHLVDFHERITLGGRAIEEKQLAGILEEVETTNAGASITFFEATTAAAFLAYSRHPADFLLLEVGLGGRLDATNVVEAPLLSVITPVSMDHERFLGTDIAAIAGEKAGILKPGTPVISAQPSPQARQVIADRARQLSLPLSDYGLDWQAFRENGRLVVRHPDGVMDLPMPALPGAHQIVNAGTAVMAARHLGLSEKAVAEGLEQARWPGRLQKLTQGRLTGLAQGELWLDGGHNPAAAEALSGWLSQHFGDRQDRVTLVCGLMAAKHAGNWLSPFTRNRVTLHCLSIPEQPNCLDAESLASLAQKAGLRAKAFESLEAAVEKAPGPVLICGSLYLAGYALAQNRREKT